MYKPQPKQNFILEPSSILTKGNVYVTLDFTGAYLFFFLVIMKTFGDKVEREQKNICGRLLLW